MHHLPGGLYTLRHARPNYPLAGLTYEERAQARAAGKAADVEALMELKGQVVADAEGLLSSWQDGQDPCTFERVGRGWLSLPCTACQPACKDRTPQCLCWRVLGDTMHFKLNKGSNSKHTAAQRSGSFTRVPCFMQRFSSRGFRRAPAGRPLTPRTGSHSGLWPAAGALRCQHRPCI